MKAIAAAFLVLLLVNLDAGFSEASLSPSCSSRNNQHLKPLRNVPRNEYSSIHTGRPTCLPPEDGVSITSTTYASIPITIEPTTRARAHGTRLSATTAASQVAVLTSPKNVVTIDNDNNSKSSNKSELRFISTNSHVVEPTIPAGMTIQFPSHQLQEIYVNGTDNVQVWEANSFTALERVVVTPRFSGRLLIQDHYDTEGEMDDDSDRKQQSLHLVVDCQSCLVQVVQFPRWIRLDQSGGTVEIRQGTLDAASRLTGGTLLVQGKIQGLDARKALAGKGSITTTTAENCHHVVYDAFWGQPCQTIHDNVNSIPPPTPFECTASPCEQTCHSVVSKSGEVSCSCESSCQRKSYTSTSSRSSSSGESSESTTTSSSSSSSSNDWPASSSSSSWSDFRWKSHDDSDSSGWWSNSGFWDNNHDKHDKHHSSSSWCDDRKKNSQQWINPIHAKASTIGGLWRVLAH